MSRWGKASQPSHVTQAPPSSFLPFAHVTAGSVVIKTKWGLTRWHALGRAARWAKQNGADGGLRVGIWSSEARIEEETDE